MHTKKVIKNRLTGDFVRKYTQSGFGTDKTESVEWTADRTNALQLDASAAHTVRALIISLPVEDGGAPETHVAIVDHDTILPGYIDMNNPAADQKVMIMNKEQFYCGHVIDGDKVTTTWGGLFKAKILTRDQAEAFIEFAGMPALLIRPVHPNYVAPGMSEQKSPMLGTPAVFTPAVFALPVKMVQRCEEIAEEQGSQLADEITAALAEPGATLLGTPFHAAGYFRQFVLYSEPAS